MDKNAKIYVAGHRGLVGSAIWNNLKSKGYNNLVGRTHKELDLLDGSAVRKFFDEEQPEYVVLAAAHVGGIMANSVYRADFIYNNLQIQQNVIGESFRHNVKKLLFLGSTCIYPRDAEQPMKEDALLTSPLEYTNEPYAIAKIAGLKMCESFNLQYGTNYIAVMPTNLYGPNDNFDLERSHVLPAMIRKIHLANCLKNNDWDAVRKDLNARPVEGVSGSNSEAEIAAILAKYGINGEYVELWGTGKPLREFLWSEEMADASVFVMEHVDFKDLKVDLSGIKDTAASMVAEGAAPSEPVYWNYGAFIQQCFDFIILALCVFMLVKLMNKLSNLKKKEEEKAATPPAPPAPTKEETLLTEIRDLLKEKK